MILHRTSLAFAPALALCILGTARGAILAPDSYFVEVGGVVVGEAENFHARAGGADTTLWKIAPTETAGDGLTTIANARGGEYIQLAPDNGGTAGGPAGNPSIQYRMNILTTGTYQLYLRWDGNGTNSTTAGASDSMYADILELKDGTGGSFADWYELGQTPDNDFATSPWDSGGQAEVNVAGPANNPMVWTISTPGVYTLRFGEREDGAAVDTWVFQLSSLAAPTGTGPAESAVIPEPTASALLLAGACGVALRRRRE